MKGLQKWPWGGLRFRFRDCTGEEGVEEDVVLGLFLLQSLCSSAGPRPGQSGGTEKLAAFVSLAREVDLVALQSLKTQKCV